MARITTTRLRFSLRTVLVLVALAAIPTSTIGVRTINQKLAVEKVLSSGGTALYGHRAFFRSGNLLVHWLHPVTYIELCPTKEFPVETQIQWVADLPKLESLSIKPEDKRQSGLTDEGARLVVERLDDLKLLKVERATCSNKSLRQVRDTLKNTRGYVTRSSPRRVIVTLNSNKSAFASWLEDVKLWGD